MPEMDQIVTMPESPAPWMLELAKQGCPTCTGCSYTCRLCGLWLDDDGLESQCELTKHVGPPWGHNPQLTICETCQRVAALIAEGHRRGVQEADHAK